MPDIIYDKEVMDRKLQYFIDNQAKLGIVVYALTRNSNTPKKMNIDPEAQRGLISLFMDNIRDNVVLNEELSILQLSASDERIKVIYQYDLEIPHELSVLDDVRQTDGHELYDIAIEGVNNIRVLLIEIGDAREQMVLYKTMAPVNIFSRKSFFLKKSRTKFEKIDDDFFRISDNFQLLRFSDGLFVFDLDTIEKSFGFHEVIIREASSGMTAIAERNIVSNIDVLEELIQDVKYARKLTKVARSSPVIQRKIETAKIILFCQNYPLLKGKIRFSDDGTQIMLDTKVSKDLFIKLLMDDFLISELTENYYNSIAKDTVEVAVVRPEVAQNPV
ncbi:anti-phage protein KwaB [Budvicia diplopodorum]|uniref:anti-phage protein KwaB n=1 Tax=Budvicia diplopodorum TaxID=1119056 RepID=UPI001357849A|nr:anti-phage protein KwaB [Budvicia diplopodorum]